MVHVKHSGKMVATATAVIGVVALITLWFVAKGRIREEWWLYKLRISNDGTTARNKLVELRSARAVPWLLYLAKDPIDVEM